MAISKDAQFRSDFAAIMSLLDTAQDHEWILVDEYVTRIGVGLQTSVIFRNLQTARGFGCVWRIDARRLEGCGGRTYYADRPDSRQNEEFLAEFSRRLGCEGASRSDVMEDEKSSRRARYKRRFKREIAQRCY
jgi:hypothetical protein